MDRRHYLLGVGSGISAALGTGTPVSATEVTRLRPPEETISTAPGTTVRFELELPTELEPGDVEWESDADVEGPAMEYQWETGNAAFDARFDSPGSGTVRAAVPDSAVIEWTVRIEPGDNPPPTVELQKDPEPGETVGANEPLEMTAVATDPAGNLDRLVWIETRNATVFDLAELRGEQDTETQTFEDIPYWIAYGYGTSVRAVTEDGRTSDPDGMPGPEVRQPIAVDIADVNDPVEAGGELEVTVTLENVGDMMMVGPDTQTIELLVGSDRETVDSETVTVGWEETETITMGYETYPVSEDVEFPIRVEGPDDEAETTVEVVVDEPTEVVVSITETNDPVGAGDTLEVSGEITNDGAETVTEDATLLVGSDREAVASESVTVGSGSSETVTLEFETYEVQTDVSFPVWLEAGDADDEVTVEVVADEPTVTAVSITGTNDPVTGGEPLSVDATLENTGETETTHSLELVVGGEVVDTETVTVAGGDTQPITLGYETFPVRQDSAFPVTVRSDDDSDTTQVQVFGTDEEGQPDDEEGQQAEEPDADATDDTEADETGPDTDVDTDPEPPDDDESDAGDAEFEPDDGEPETDDDDSEADDDDSETDATEDDSRAEGADESGTVGDEPGAGETAEPEAPGDQSDADADTGT